MRSGSYHLDGDDGRHQRRNDSRYDARGCRTPLRRLLDDASCRISYRQRKLLHGARDNRVRTFAGPDARFYARPKPRIKWHGGIVREDVQTRLRSLQSASRCNDGSCPTRLVVRRLQHIASAPRAQNALASRVYPSQFSTRCVSGLMGATPVLLDPEPLFIGWSPVQAMYAAALGDTTVTRQSIKPSMFNGRYRHRDRGGPG